jgi:acyl-CoA synthetase (AMP-forming)/AMP-acid ligase II
VCDGVWRLRSRHNTRIHHGGRIHRQQMVAAGVDDLTVRPPDHPWFGEGALWYPFWMEHRLPPAPYPPTLPKLLRMAAQHFGDADYVVTKDSRLSFREAEERSRAVAWQLLAHGAGKGTPIGIVMPNSIEWVVAWLAAARIGALTMLLPSTFRPRELQRALVIGDVSCLFAPTELFGQEYLSRLEETVPSLATHERGPIFDPGVPFLRSIYVPDPTEKAWATTISLTGGAVSPDQDSLIEAVEQEISPADSLLVIFTSGSTADPKAIVHSHGAAIRKTSPEHGMGLSASRPGRVFCAMPFFWVGGIQEILGALHSGAMVIAQSRLDVSEALDLVERESCTSIDGWAYLTEQVLSDPTFASRSLPELTVNQRIFSSRGHSRNLGMTETFGPNGNVEWFEHKIVDPDTGSTLPDTAEGELCVRGFGVMQQMYKREREEVFDRDGWFHTGDTGYIEDGVAWFTGRRSEIIKSAGTNVSPAEVESVLLELPGVSMAFVLGIPGVGGSDDVVALLVSPTASDLSLQDIETHAKQHLSSYKVPKRWLVIPPSDLPWLATGKPDKRALRDLFPLRHG